MIQKKNNYIPQYKVLFCMSWVVLYLIFPAWISFHSDVLSWGFVENYPLARSIAILGLMTFFFVSAHLMNRYFNTLTVDKPLFIRGKNWSENIRNNIWLVIVCCVSVVLHLHSFSLVQTSYLIQGLWMYDFSVAYWNRLFDIPIQYFFWICTLFILILIRQKNLTRFISEYARAISSLYSSSFVMKPLFFFSIFGLVSLYSFLFPYYSWFESLQLLRYPPVSKFIYLITYYAFGVSDLGPRVVQLIFYLLGSVYIYRTISLFRERAAAIFGATIYLFSPIIFYYASASALASGTVFFIIIISYYFLRFIKGGDNRDLILATYFIGMGFMYKRVILIMFCICFTYLVLRKFIKRDRNSLIHFKVLLLSLVPILPWLIIGSSTVAFGLTWSQLISFDRLVAYALTIQAQLSWVMIILFLLSFIYALFIRRDDLSLYFGLLFIAYYTFFTLGGGKMTIHRYSMALYPAISVLSAQFLYSMSQRIRWKHTFKLVAALLTFFLIIISVTPRSRLDLTMFKYYDVETQYYPIIKATDWIRGNAANDEKILSLNMPNYQFYMERIYPDKERINHERFTYFNASSTKALIYPFKKLMEYCHENGIAYIMFPVKHEKTLSQLPPHVTESLKYLEENMKAHFIEAAKLNIDDNYIIIYKPKENFVR